MRGEDVEVGEGEGEGELQPQTPRPTLSGEAMSMAAMRPLMAGE